MARSEKGALRPPLTFSNSPNTMPTIAEIIAAKKAATKGGSVSPTAVIAPKESIAQRLAAEESIDRIDPPGKFAARKSAGLILNKDLPAAENNQRMEVPRELSQPSNDQQMCVVIEGATVWLCMPCEDPTVQPIKVLRLPLTVWPYPAPEPLPEGDPF